MSILPQGYSLIIRKVREDNLVKEFSLIQEIVDEYPYISMDTKFHGTVVRPVGNFNTCFPLLHSKV
jgi:CCR4-NOT transcription complex subunit 7/8